LAARTRAVRVGAEEPGKQLRLQPGDFGRAVLARPGQVDVEHDPALLEHDHPGGKNDGLGDVVGHQHRGEPPASPDALEQRLHLDPGQRV
jgi:hypothetical protein